MKRRITFYSNPFTEFYSKQSLKVQKKIEYVFNLIKQVERVPEKFFKHLTGTNGLYEIRVEYESNIFRTFCCLDEGKLVVLPNPVSDQAQIRFELNQAARGSLTLYDLQGRKIRTIREGNFANGQEDIEINVNDLSSGTYLLRLVTQNQILTQKMIVGR